MERGVEEMSECRRRRRWLAGGRKKRKGRFCAQEGVEGKKGERGERRRGMGQLWDHTLKNPLVTWHVPIG
jgi:hypothetical protein